ncbi:MAG TPA: hypothetical protein VK348_01410, partial [Planctomycetota bacterium]|nr:hypothetical protein [Planctomycetota bacterium]
VHGHGLRNNIAERVQTFTSTAWTMLNAAVYCVTGNIYYTSIVLSLLCTLAAVLLAIHRHRQNLLQVAFAFAATGLSIAFMDFSVGGFENPLSHLVCAAFAWVWFTADFGPRRFTRLFLVAACAGLTRLDTLALYLPPLLVEFCGSPLPLRQRLRLALLALSPLLAWQLFALVYFGFPLQNAAYAKRFNGIPTSEFVRAGVDYFMNSIYRDPLTLTVVAASTAVGFRSRDRRLVAIAIGVLLYLLYVLYVGGCYMSGRFFTLPLFASVIALLHSGVLARPQTARAALAVVIVLGCLGKNPTFTTGKDYGKDRERSATSEWLDKGIADERASWYQHSGLLLASRNTPLPRPLPEWDFQRALAQFTASMHGGPCVGTMAPAGYFSFFAPREYHIYDLNGQVDPLMARLPIALEAGWKQAHHFREPVPGYQDSLVAGDNRIEDPDLREYYDKIRLLTRGEIWSWQRLCTIVAMNLGRYDHLLAAYEARRRAAQPAGR